MIALRRRALIASALTAGNLTFYVEISPYSNEYESYTADAGVTWEEWVNSDYNTNGFYCSGSYVYNSEGNRVYNDDYGYDHASPWGFIEKEHYYKVQYS